MALMLRGKVWYFVKRVPREFRGVDPRKMVWVSLKTDSERDALAKVAGVEEALSARWRAMSMGVGDPARHDELVKIAAAQGHRYKPLREFYAREGLEGVLARIEGLDPAEARDPTTVAAVLGGEPRPDLRLSAMADLWFDIEKVAAVGKSADQVRRWKNPRYKAMGNLIKVIGDKPMERVDRDDALDFRDWWADRIVAGMTPNSASKDLTYVASTFQRIIDRRRVPMENPFQGLRFKGASRQRPAFSAAWIRDRLTMEALAGLNDEARDVLLVMVNTGCRLSEICGLLPGEIRLDDAVPHIVIQSNAARAIKTANSERVMPLVGVSLEAMARHPSGFPRYRGKDRVSATINKYLRENGLLESPDHTAYSLRHAFEDRMLAINLPDRLAAELMGHALSRERYGVGPSLAQKLEAVSRLAI